MLPLTPATVRAVMAVEPGIATPDELESALARLEPLVAALKLIRPGIVDEGEMLASYLGSLRPPTWRGQKPDADELERFHDALDQLSSASWMLVAMRAAEEGYFVPCSRDRMISLVSDALFRARAAPKTRRGKASDGHHVAFACAILYFLGTGERPKVLNYASAQIGAYNDYAMLVQAAVGFLCPGISWGFLARDAARDLAGIVKNA